jgi:hypothetical protein
MRRPVFAIMLNLLVVLFGIVGYLRLAGARTAGRRSADRDRDDVVSGARARR